MKIEKKNIPKSIHKYNWLRIISLTIGLSLLLMLAGVVFLQTPFAKNVVRKKAVSFLQHKLGTPVSVGKLDYNLLGWIKLNSILLIDQQKDTLLNGESIYVSFHLMGLIRGKIDLNEIAIQQLQVHLKRKSTDTSFNFQYIIDAFASKSSKKTAKPIQLSVDKIALQSIELTFDDAKQQRFFQSKLSNLVSSIKQVDIDKMQFAINDFILQNASFVMVDKGKKGEKQTIAPTTSKPSPFQLSAHHILIEKLSVSYQNIDGKLNYSNLIDTLQTEDATVNVLSESFAAQSILLNNSRFNLSTNDPKVVLKDTVKQVFSFVVKLGWNVKAGKISLHHNSVAIDNNAFDTAKEGIDYNHLKLANIYLQANTLHYHADSIAGNIESGSVLGNNFLVKDIKGICLLDEKHASAKSFRIVTQQSLIAANAEVVFNQPTHSLTQGLGNISEATKITLAIDTANLGYGEFLFFFPSYKRTLPLALTPNQKIMLLGKAAGTLKEMNLTKLLVKTDNQQFQLDVKGKLQHLLTPKSLQYNLAISKLFVAKAILAERIKQQLLAKKINLPSNLLLVGTLKGGISATHAIVKMSSPFGLANIDANVSNLSTPKNISYTVAVLANRLQTGKWFYQDSLLGPLTGKINLKGKGFNYAKDNIQATTAIKSWMIKGYNYTNLNLKAAINKGAFTTKGNIRDTNMVAAIDMNGTINGKYPTLKGIINIHQIDLAKMHFTKDSIQLKSIVQINASSLDPQTLNVLVRLDSNNIIYNGKHWKGDSILITANAANDSTQFFVNAPFAQASLIGKYDYQHLPTAISAFVKQHIVQSKKETTKAIKQQAVLTATLFPDASLRALYPLLEIEKPATVFASFNNGNKDSTLKVIASIPSIIYNENEVNNLSLNAIGADSSMDVALATQYIIIGTKKYFHAGINATLADTTLLVAAATDDAKGKPFYAIGGVVTLLKDATKIHLSDSLMLNYGNWVVAKNNFVEIRKEGYIVHDFAMTKNTQSVEIHNQTPTAASPILVKIDHFRLSQLLAIANQDSTLAGGFLSADATIAQPIVGLPAVEGNISVQQLTYQKVVLGDVALKTKIGVDKIIGVQGGITGANNLTVVGGYNTTDQAFSINTDIKQLNLKAIEAFSQGNIIRTAGNVHGNVFASGTLSKPTWKGELVFDTTQFATRMFGSLYKINNQKIDFEYPNIGLYDFTLTDSLDNKLVIDGTIKRLPEEDFALNLTANTQNFIAINQVRTPNALIYGLGMVDADLLIAGTTTTPDISGNVSLDNKSDIHYILPTKNNYKDDLKQVVKFIDIDTIPSFRNDNQIYTSAADTIGTIKYNGVTYNLNISVRDNANITVLMDPSTGDELKIKGRAQLNAGLDENGILGISGVYQLKEGSYNLSYQFIKKRFDLVDGSTITFSGNPMEAQADITAKYNIETSPTELLNNEISAGGAELGAAYSKKIPFEVILKIKGPISKPELSFDIKVKDNADGVNTTLGITIENKLA